MKKLLKCGVLFAVLALLLSSCGNSDSSDAFNTVYNDFVQKSGESTLHVTNEYVYTDDSGAAVADFSITYDISKNALYAGTVTSGAASADFSVCQDQGKLYASYDKQQFAVTDGESLQALPSAKLFTAGNFTSVKSENSANDVTYTLTGMQKAEPWMVQGVELNDFTAKAVSTDDGVVQSLSASYSFVSDGIKCTHSVSVAYATEDVTVQAFTAEEGKSFATVDAFMQTVRADAYLQSAKTLTSEGTFHVACNAGGLLRDQTTALYITEIDGAAEYRLDKNVTTTDYSRSGSKTAYSQTERFLDGAYELTVGGKKREDVAEIDSQTMANYCSGIVYQTLPEWNSMGNVALESDESGTYLVFSETAAITKQIRAYASLEMYQDASLLDTMSQDYATQSYEYKLQLHPVTGVPMASGYTYTAEHSIASFGYTLEIEHSQTYYFDKASSDVDTEIRK